MQAYLPTDGVTFEAVKEQLALLGHDIPDHVIRTFLKDGSTKIKGEPSDQGLSEGGEERDGVSIPNFDDASFCESNYKGNAQPMGISVESHSWAAGSIDHWDAAAASDFAGPEASYPPETVILQHSGSHSSVISEGSGQPQAPSVTSDSPQSAAASDSGVGDGTGPQQEDSQAGMAQHQCSSVQPDSLLMMQDLDDLNLVEVGASHEKYRHMFCSHRITAQGDLACHRCFPAAATNCLH